jgi:3-oxoacyl-[acyl-carrier protein] reductase
MASLKGKVAVITGASRGLGEGMALELASRGAAVSVLGLHSCILFRTLTQSKVMLLYTSDSSTQRISSLITKISALPNPPEAVGCKVDLSAPSASDTVLASLNSWLGPSSQIHILVNNAGVEVNKPLGSITVDDYEKVFNLNVRGALLLTQGLLPRFSPKDNRIINIGSVGARAGFASLGLYCASKAALEGLTRCWAAELGGNGTTVNQINPGPVQSDMLDNIPKEIVEMQKANTPVQHRLGTIDEVARIVAWLAGPDSAWITGQVISASGGWAMY